MRADRDAENSAHNERSGNTLAIVNALNQILSMLAEAVFAEKGRATVLSEIQTEHILKRIAQELGSNSPILQLIAMTTEFDVGTVERIIVRLENIRDSAIALQTQDDSDNAESQQTFETIVQQLAELREKFVFDLA